MQSFKEQIGKILDIDNKETQYNLDTTVNG